MCLAYNMEGTLSLSALNMYCSSKSQTTSGKAADQTQSEGKPVTFKIKLATDSSLYELEHIQASRDPVKQ